MELCGETWDEWTCDLPKGHAGTHSAPLPRELNEAEEAERVKEREDEILADMMRKILGRGPDPFVWVSGPNLIIDGSIDLTAEERALAIRVAEANDKTVVTLEEHDDWEEAPNPQRQRDKE